MLGGERETTTAAALLIILKYKTTDQDPKQLTNTVNAQFKILLNNFNSIILLLYVTLSAN